MKHLIYATSTAVLFMAVGSAEVMQRHPEILINDLYGVVSESPAYDEWRKRIDVHFYQKQEQELL